MQDKLVAFADDLEGLLTGALPEDAFRERYRHGYEAPDIGALMAYVDHFLCDSDIRQKDEWYRQMQEHEMRKMIARLRGGEVADAKRIDFLGYSDGEEREDALSLRRRRKGLLACVVVAALLAVLLGVLLAAARWL
jgi:hypothetical protein